MRGDEWKEKEILTALDNAYRITKYWGKIYGIHDKGSSKDEIIDALNRTDYKRDAEYREWYMCFIIDKE